MNLNPNLGNLHKENVEELMQKLRQNVTDIRTEICQTVEQKYGQYLLNSIENARNLNTKLAVVVEEIDKTKKKIDAQVKKQYKYININPNLCFYFVFFLFIYLLDKFKH